MKRDKYETIQLVWPSDPACRRRTLSTNGWDIGLLADDVTKLLPQPVSTYLLVNPREYIELKSWWNSNIFIQGCTFEI